MGFHIGAWLHHGVLAYHGIRSHDRARGNTGAIPDYGSAIDNGPDPDGDVVADPDPGIGESLTGDKMGTESRPVSYHCILADNQKREIKKNPGREGVSA
jgi:hypothetical protein